MAGDVVAGEIFAAHFGADAGKERIDSDEKFFGRQTVPLGIPHPLVAHGADAALEVFNEVMPASVAATMSQCSSAVTNFARFSGLWRSQWRSLAKPHSWE